MYYEHNIKNVTMPSIIYGIMVDDNFGISIENTMDASDIEIGEKYYGIFNNKCIAFKVLSVSFGKYDSMNTSKLVHTDNFTAIVTLTSKIFYELLLADGSHIYYSLNDFKRLTKFYSKEDYFEYVDDKDESHKVKCCRLLETSYYKPIEECFGANLGFHLSPTKRIATIYLKGFSAKNGCVNSCRIPMQYLWVDIDGVHYSASKIGDNGDEFFYTEKEAKKSLIRVLDFDDEIEKEKIINLNLSIKESDKEAILNLLSDYFE